MSEIEELYERAKSGDPHAQYEFGMKLLVRWQSDPGAASADKLLSNSFYWLEKAEAVGNEPAARIIAGLKANLSSASAPIPQPMPTPVPAIVRRDKEKIKRLGGVILTMAGIIIVMLVVIVLLFSFRSCKSSVDEGGSISSGDISRDNEDAFAEDGDSDADATPSSTPTPTPVSTPASTPEPTPYPWADAVESQPAEVWSAPVEFEMLLDGDTLNMRLGPSTNYAVVTQIPSGAIVPAWAEDGEWLLVEYDSKYGWASHTCLYEYDIVGYEGVDVMPEGQYENPVQYTASAAERCEMYAGPDLNVYHKLAIIPEGESVSAVAGSGNWLFVYYKGVYGWVQEADLTEV